jgi:hypothetical protein
VGLWEAQIEWTDGAVPRLCVEATAADGVAATAADGKNRSRELGSGCCFFSFFVCSFLSLLFLKRTHDVDKNKMLQHFKKFVNIF